MMVNRIISNDADWTEAEPIIIFYTAFKLSSVMRATHSYRQPIVCPGATQLFGQFLRTQDSPSM